MMTTRTIVKFIDLRLEAALGIAFCTALLGVIGLGVARPIYIVFFGDLARGQDVDALSVIVSSLGVIVTTLGVGIAILAFYGFQTFERAVDRAVKKRVKVALLEGGEISIQVAAALNSEQFSKRMAEKIERGGHIYNAIIADYESQLSAGLRTEDDDDERD